MIKRWVVFTHGLFFVLGFSFIFIFVIGISAGVIGQISERFFLIRDWVLRIGGLLVIVLGLHTLGVIRIPFLYYDTRRQKPPKKELGYIGSFLMGIAFAAGWSPCVGPILGGILALGASTGSIGQAVVLLAFYALGLGIPFLVTALLMEQAAYSIRKLQRHVHIIEIASGILLIGIGLLIFSNSLQSISILLSGGTDLAILLDEWLIGLAGANILTIPLAFLAGLFSFLSPCVLPLVPAYIGYLTGQATNTLGDALAEKTATQPPSSIPQQSG